MSATEDAEHLRLLAIFHYVYAGMNALFGLFPIFHLAFGIAMVTGALDQIDKQGNPPPRELGWFFIAIAGMMMAIFFIGAFCIAVAGRCIATRTWPTYVFVIAALECPMMPIGTALGVFTLIVLNKPEVKKLFEAQQTGWSHEAKQPSYLDDRY